MSDNILLGYGQIFQKKIDNFPDYEINILGEVYKLNRKIKSRIDCEGYKSINIRKDKKITKARIHRLLGLAFIQNPLNKRTINHIDGNKLNNSLSNLEWATHGENTAHSYRVLKRVINTKGKYGSKHIASKKVIRINKEDKKIYGSIVEAGLDGFTRQAISNCLNGRAKTHKDYTWKYAEV